MVLMPIPTIVAIETNSRLRKEKKKKALPVKTPKSPEVRYRKELNKLVISLHKTTIQRVVPMLRALESQYISDSYANDFEKIFENLRLEYAGISKQAKIAADQFVMGVSEANKSRFYRSIENIIGINMQSIIQNENLEGVLTATTNQNVNLIKTIPEEYFKTLETIVYTGTTQGNQAASIIKQITKLGHSTNKRAKLIARDQTSKLNAALNQKRQTNLGIEEYIWRTAGDDRVRESHRKKNGKTFRWDDPPKDTGPPGEDIQCRCVAQPIIKL